MMRFRREAFRLFVDESGWLRAPRDERQNEVGVLAGVMIPDSASDQDALRQLVAQLRHHVFGDSTDQQDIKGQLLDEAAYDLIARKIRERWFLGYKVLPITQKDVQELTAAFRTLSSNVELMRARLAGSSKQRDLRIDFLKRQWDSALDRHPVYLALLHSLFMDIGVWFRRESTLPRLRVWLDDKLERADEELHGFLGRFAIYTLFPEVYSDRLGEVMGVDHSPDFGCTVSSDSVQDGLVIADAIAYALGRVHRGEDSEGVYQRALDRMKR